MLQALRQCVRAGCRHVDTANEPLPIAMAPRLHANDASLKLGPKTVSAGLHATENELEASHGMTVKVNHLDLRSLINHAWIAATAYDATNAGHERIHAPTHAMVSAAKTTRQQPKCKERKS